MSKKIRKNAIHLSQNGSSLTVLSLTANELITNTKVDKFNSNLDLMDENNGYQRPATPSRVKKLGNTLHKNTTEGEDFPMPTAVLFSDRGVNITYGDGYVEFDAKDLFPIIDGQHRVNGLKYAIEEKNNEIIGDYEYPVVIMHNLDKLKEMRQFSVVNGTAKSVNTALVYYQLSQIQEELGDDELKEAEKWKVIGAKILKNLNTDDKSVWYKRILMPDQNKFTKAEITKDPSKAFERITTATSFIVSLRPVISYADKKVLRGKTINEKVAILTDIVNAWWTSLSKLMPDAFNDPVNHVTQKTAGIFALHMLLKDKFQAARVANIQTDSSDVYLTMLEGGYNCMRSKYWSTKEEDEDFAEANQFGSMAGFKVLYDQIDEELMMNDY